MSQSRLTSLVEASMNVGLGFFVSFAVYLWIIGPIFNIPVTPADSLAVTLFFTATSLVRAYLLRRVFNNGWHNIAASIARRLE